MAIDADPSDRKLAKPTTEQTPGEPAFAGPGRAAAVSLALVVALSGLSGWLGYRVYELRQEQLQRNLFVETARQGALNLTTIDYTDAEADVLRIVESATGTFRDDFEKRSQPFIDVVKQAQSKSQGYITEASLESQAGDTAQVLVAVTVNTSMAGATEEQRRVWRMRIAVQQVDGGAKVSGVEFVQ